MDLIHLDLRIDVSRATMDCCDVFKIGQMSFQVAMEKCLWQSCMKIQNKCYTIVMFQTCLKAYK